MANNGVKKTSQEDWHPADIKAALEKAGWTLKALADHHGIKGSSSLSHTFWRSYPANEKRIADAIGVTPQEIWPTRYNQDGTKKPRGLRANHTRQSTERACQLNGNFKAAA